jgi:CO/xanthine dehydrogenase Mo-binding subunit
VADAALRVRAKALAVAAELLEAAADDLQLTDSTISVVGAPGRSLALGQVAAALASSDGRAAGLGPALEDQGAFDPDTVTFANGVHAVVVEVDPETGGVTLRRYVVVHDCGRLINPMIVEGQVAGGVAQGIGGALHEELIYDPNGQLLTASFLDYGLPEATDVPAIEVHHLETPSTRNPLGLKGVGEAGAIAVAAAVAGAVEDALAPFGARVTRCPLTPERVAALPESTKRTSA